MTDEIKKRQLFADLGKATRRGIRKCPQCGTINGTRGMSCKNSLCDMVFKESLDKPRRVNLDACKIITEESSCMSWTTIFSVPLYTPVIWHLSSSHTSSTANHFFSISHFLSVIQALCYD